MEAEKRKTRDAASARSAHDMNAALQGIQTETARAVDVTATCAEAVPPFGLSDEGDTAQVAPAGAPEQESVTG